MQSSTEKETALIEGRKIDSSVNLYLWIWDSNVRFRNYETIRFAYFFSDSKKNESVLSNE